MTLVPCVLYRKSTDSIIDYDTQLNSDSLPVVGLDPDLEYYAKYTPYPEPEFDPRGFRLITTSNITVTPHPVYQDLNQYEITFDTERRTDVELYNSVQEAQDLADTQLRTAYKSSTSKQFRLQKIQNKRIKGISIPVGEWEDALELEMDELADKLDSNADNADLMNDFIEANPTLVPDFDSGWITS